MLLNALYNPVEKPLLLQDVTHSLRVSRAKRGADTSNSDAENKYRSNLLRNLFNKRSIFK